MALIAYAVIRVLIVYSFPTGTAVLAQEIPGILLIALVVVLIRLRVPRRAASSTPNRLPSQQNPLRPAPTVGQAGAEHTRHS